MDSEQIMLERIIEDME